MDINLRIYHRSESGFYTIKIDGVKVPIQAYLDNDVNICGTIVELSEFDPRSAQDVLRAIRESPVAIRCLQQAAAYIEHVQQLRSQK